MQPDKPLRVRETRHGKTFTLAPNSVIYEQGSESDAVYLIQEGRVELLRSNQQDKVGVGILEKGAILGEMGVLRSVPRSTTARALTEVSLHMVTRDRFLKSLQTESSLTLPVLRTLTNRLHEANGTLARMQPYGTGVPLKRVRTITLLPGSSLTQWRLGVHGFEVEHLTFIVGRASDGIPARLSEGGMTIETEDTDALEEEHFGLFELNGRLVIHDLGSDGGTTVNGATVSRGAYAGTAGLVAGDNDVAAGPAQSGYRFIIRVT